MTATGKEIACRVQYSSRLVNLARASDQLRFGRFVAGEEYDSLYENYECLAEESDANVAFLPDNKRRTGTALEAISSAANVVEQAFLSLLAAESERYGGVEYNGITMTTPSWVKSLFMQCSANVGSLTLAQVEQQVQSGLRVAYWENGWNLRGNTYETWLFPREIDPSVIEVWWSLVGDYAAPSFLKSVSEAAWEIIHAEE